MLRTLRQPRYAALSLLMLLVAAICVAAGTWQIYRLAYKVTTNHDLRSNAKDRPAAVASLARPVLPRSSRNTREMPIAPG